MGCLETLIFQDPDQFADLQMPGKGITTKLGMGGPVQPFTDILPAVLDAADPRRCVAAIMHSDFAVTDAALEILRDHWDGALAVYPNSGYFVDLHMQFDSVCSPAQFEHAARRWIDRGAGEGGSTDQWIRGLWAWQSQSARFRSPGQ